MIKIKIMIWRLLFSICILGLILVTSCTTYLIPVDSFKMQFAGIDSTKLKQINVTGPIGESYNYLSNPLRTIKCVDKKGNSYELTNSPSIEIRFTYGEKNKRTVFYFDRIYVNDSCVVGVQSRFISSIRKTIPLKSITKIEIQDGKKNFH
jgi:hypothetical protein